MAIAMDMARLCGISVWEAAGVMIRQGLLRPRFDAAAFVRRSAPLVADDAAREALAEWIAGGEAPMDLWPVDIRRFGQLHRDRRWVLARTLEAYGKHYTMAWPFEEYRSARPLRVSPLYHAIELLRALTLGTIGWEQLVNVTYLALLGAGGLFVAQRRIGKLLLR